MIYELEDIKKIRKKIGITQKELARVSGVSQSFLAKIECGKINPSFNKMKKIFNALDNIARNNTLKALDIMNKDVITATPDDKIENIVKLMNKYAISQIPVMEGKKPIGMITENDILESLQNDPRGIQFLTVKEVMEDCPPIISQETGIDVVMSLMRHFQIILVARNGRLVGIITKSDILGKITSIDLNSV